jgi:hypothetical protein
VIEYCAERLVRVGLREKQLVCPRGARTLGPMKQKGRPVSSPAMWKAVPGTERRGEGTWTGSGVGRGADTGERRDVLTATANGPMNQFAVGTERRGEQATEENP